MNREAKRFVAINAVLHGHNVLDVFDGSLSTMADCLGVTQESAAMLVKELDKVKGAPMKEDPLVNVFLNFFRTTPYAFVAMGNDAITLSRFVQNDLDGQVSDELRYAFITQMIKDVVRGDQHVSPVIRDGVLYCTREDFERVEPCIVEAYQLYMSGPIGTTKQLAKLLRKYTNIEGYVAVTPKECFKTLSLIAKAGVDPMAYQRTMLSTPDLFGTYKLTGAVIAFTDSTEDNVNWLIDVSDSEEDSMMHATKLSLLQSYIEKGCRGLENVVANVSSNGGISYRLRKEGAI